MIPNKIYLPKYPNLDIEGEHLGDDWSYEPEFTDNVTYIRKYALLKWLESKVYEHNEDRFDDGFNAALGQVIDKLNEM